MKLKDLVSRIDGEDESLVIFSSQRSRDAEVVLIDEDLADEPASTPQGFAYLLEVSAAKDAVRVWSEWRQGRSPTVDEATDAVLYYAEHDAFQPTS